MHVFKKFTLAFALYVALVTNASLSFFLHQFFANTGGSNLLMPIGIMLIALFDDTNKNEIWLSLCSGIIADLYYFGIIGIYTISLPIICWGLQRIARFLPEVFWVRILVVLLTVILLDSYTWMIINLVGISSISVTKLLTSIIPTLCWSLLFTIITYKLWDVLASNYPFMVNLDNYKQ
ncbi:MULTISPECIES: rod shape-determining protein MreD [unclassified Lactobacillus]|uniref:rod shape-determining protein MreD n=1 Tax=unclassified Lactobacillus TaxID=2620435 RepID=UPI000EFD3FE3|nr:MULTISPECIES: rod shape-determining protein MreD [unclassified Lactobacillus]RMC25095.1 rod shape-determining protein MreD [Lactobacillus sp. ESL0247]RMC29250.1 rod shape-determining protein MreD [Lactobacillus sp. ESL0246]RMC32270.1 rod shape-determining protein MreD [Lactobacillus sp. ESL0245]RMC48686.1 rod shape-determining protein MreD [Lactobacillus sp. ESL0228]